MWPCLTQYAQEELASLEHTLGGCPYRRYFRDCVTSSNRLVLHLVQSIWVAPESSPLCQNEPSIPNWWLDYLLGLLNISFMHLLETPCCVCICRFWVQIPSAIAFRRICDFPLWSVILGFIGTCSSRVVAYPYCNSQYASYFFILGLQDDLTTFGGDGLHHRGRYFFPYFLLGPEHSLSLDGGNEECWYWQGSS